MLAIFLIELSNHLWNQGLEFTTRVTSILSEESADHPEEPLVGRDVHGLRVELKQGIQ